MRHGVLVLAGLALAQPLHGQRASVDSAAIVALELEMSRLLMAGQVRRVCHPSDLRLRPDHPEGYVGGARRGPRELADAWGRWPHAADRPLGASVRRCGSADGCRGGSGLQRTPHADHQDVRASAGAVAAGGAPQFGHLGTLTHNPRMQPTGRGWIEARHGTLTLSYR